MIVGKVDGKYDFGFMGMIPKVVLPMAKPKMDNNGFNSFVGHPKVSVPGLGAAIDGGNGHVMVFYSCGGKFGTFASNNFGNDTYIFS